MRRVLSILFVLAVCGAAVVLTAASSDEGATGKEYKIIFDNAFGLVEGGDFRVGGVRAGETTGFEATKDQPPKAEVTAKVSVEGFDDFRKDATCTIKPQSLIGEYYVDCQPGTSDEKIPDGGKVPVEQTESTIPPDLVGNILRRPVRERFRLIIAELGTGLAGRPDDLQEVLRRAHPGLRETSKVLKILARQNRTIERFIADADTVVGALEARKGEVTRWIDEAGETAEISATRREELRQTFAKLPGFINELGPTMGSLENVADEQIPLLADVQRAAPDLDRFLTLLGPFAEASRPALRALGNASEVGARAFKRGSTEVAELRRLARNAPATARPLRQFLESFDDRRRATDNDPRALVNGPPAGDPSQNNGGKGGFTGFESLWNYPFWQTLSINGFDTIGHALRISLTISDCSEYENRNPRLDPSVQEHFDKCNQWLGPYQPGITAPDPTDGSATAARLNSESGRPARAPGERRAPGEPEAGPLPGQRDISKPQIQLPPALQQLLDRLPTGDALDRLLPGVDRLPSNTQQLLDGLDGRGGQSSRPQQAPQSVNQLLDYLLAP